MAITPSIENKIRSQVLISYGVAIGIAVAVVLTYVVSLWHVHGLTATNDPSAWGQFGDYVGGLLNPLIAGLAFYWLTQSVQLQHKEMSETREALKQSAAAQDLQVEQAVKAAQINALHALLTSHNQEIAVLSDLENQAVNKRADLIERRQPINAMGYRPIRVGPTPPDEQELSTKLREYRPKLDLARKSRDDVMTSLSSFLSLPVRTPDVVTSESSID